MELKLFYLYIYIYILSEALINNLLTRKLNFLAVI